MTAQRRRLTARQTAVLAAVERLGDPNMLELSAEIGGAPSSIVKVLEALEDRGLIERWGQPDLIYIGGVRFSVLSRGEPKLGESLRRLLTECERIGMEPWVDCDRRVVAVWVPLRAIEAALADGDHLALSNLRDKVQTLHAEGAIARAVLRESVQVTSGGVLALVLRLVPPNAASSSRG